MLLRNRSHRRWRFALAAFAGVLMMASTGETQARRPRANSAERPEPVIIYRREVFNYTRAGRPDPFRSLVGNTDVGMRLEDLALRGVVYHPDPSRSVAVLARAGESRMIRAKVGDRVGGMRILAIRPRSVDVLVEDLGVSRRETIEITKAPASSRPASNAPVNNAPAKGGT